MANLGQPQTKYLRGVPAPVPYFAQPFADSVLEQSDFVAGVFEFVDVGPDFRLPG